MDVTARLISSDDVEPVIKGFAAQNDFHLLTTGFESGATNDMARDYVLHAIEERKRREAFRYGLWIESDVMIGVVELHSINWLHRRAEIGIQIWDQSKRKKGYGGLALKKIVNLAFSQLNLNRLSATITVGNSASDRLFESAGFVKEGDMAQYLFVDGSYRDARKVRLLQEEYKN